MIRTARRRLLLAGSAALLLPMLGRADEGDEDPDPRRVEIGATAMGGRTRYTSCGSTYEVAYAGGSAFVQGGGPGGPSYRAEIGAAASRDRQVSDEEGPVVDPDARWKGSFYTFGQVGEDWKWFGFLVGGGLAYIEELAPLPAVTVRIGPRRPLRLDLHLLDFSPWQRGIAAAEVVFSWDPRLELAVGARLLYPADSQTATFRFDFPLGGGLRVGILGGGGVMARELVIQGELSVRAAL